MAAGLTHRLSVGDEAPDFQLRATRAVAGGGGTAQEKCTFRLSEHRGKPVALTFTMAAFTSV